MKYSFISENNLVCIFIQYFAHVLFVIDFFNYYFFFKWILDRKHNKHPWAVPIVFLLGLKSLLNPVEKKHLT